MNIPIGTLRYIVMLDDGLNYNQIAASIGKSHQAITQAITAAEKSTKLSLVHSSRQGNTLTEIGERIAVLARRAVVRYDQTIAFINLMQKVSKNDN